MDLGKEIEEFKLAFKNGNALTRVITVMGFIITASSLAELSSKIVAWKGFILDGLNFYHSVFVEPVAYIATFVGLEYSETEIHVATISSICIAVGMRIQAMGQVVAYRKISERYGKEVTPNLALWWIVAIVVPICQWMWLGVRNPQVYPWLVVVTSLLFPVFTIIPKVLMSRFGNYEFYEQGSFSYFKSYYIYIGALFLLVCTLAAINSGLQGDAHFSNELEDITTAPVYQSYVESLVLLRNT
ncbi:heme transporter CcmC [Vibrio diabolicus]|uniref:heme transporter CcmC n=1 Tax=Vibrio diabolicus TaxID=50719 RepID=UPI0035C66B1E